MLASYSTIFPVGALESVSNSSYVYTLCHIVLLTVSMSSDTSTDQSVIDLLRSVTWQEDWLKIFVPRKRRRPSPKTESIFFKFNLTAKQQIGEIRKVYSASSPIALKVCRVPPFVGLERISGKIWSDDSVVLLIGIAGWQTNFGLESTSLLVCVC